MTALAFIYQIIDCHCKNETLALISRSISESANQLKHSQLD